MSDGAEKELPTSDKTVKSDSSSPEATASGAKRGFSSQSASVKPSIVGNPGTEGESSSQPHLVDVAPQVNRSGAFEKMMAAAYEALIQDKTEFTADDPENPTLSEEQRISEQADANMDHGQAKDKFMVKLDQLNREMSRLLNEEGSSIPKRNIEEELSENKKPKK
jgi:hypothetical protein